MKKAALKECGFINLQSGDHLLDLAFLVFDVLAHDGVVLFNDHLFGHCTCVFLRDVEMPGPRGGVQADLDGGRLRHISYPLIAGRGRHIA